MYDFTPPVMQAQFNLINKSNQSIKLFVSTINKKSMEEYWNSCYSYNKICIFLNIPINIKILNIILIFILRPLIKLISIELFLVHLFMIIVLNTLSLRSQLMQMIQSKY